jgi:uncharacterized protein
LKRQPGLGRNFKKQGDFMSLTVTEDLKELAREGNISHDEFINCIQHSLPRAWQVIEGLADVLRTQPALAQAIHAPLHMEDEQRGQLLRLMASSSMRAAVEQHYGLRFEFQNCHKTAAFRQDAIGSEEHRHFISPEAQILAQAPEFVDC